MLRPIMALLEKCPALLRATEEALAGSAELVQNGSRLCERSSRLVDEAVEHLSGPNTAKLAKYEPSYSKESSYFMSNTKVERIKLSRVISSDDLAEPTIKLFPNSPPEITLPSTIASHKKADALLTADFANMIHWDDAARAAVSKIDRRSSTISSEITTVNTSAQEMEELAINGATSFIRASTGNAFTEFLAKRYGYFTYDRLYNARTALQNV